MSINKVDDAEFKRIDVKKISVNEDESDTSSGIIDTSRINASNEIQTDKLYCKSLVVTDDLFIPIENMSDLTTTRITIKRAGNNRFLTIPKNMGSIKYDGNLKDLRTTTNTGEKRSITDTNINVTNNSRFKENITLQGWSPDTNEDTTLHQINGKLIDLEDHVYYQGCGYAVGFNNTRYLQDNGSSVTKYQPIAFMSRIDYFVVTIDSFSNIDSFPVNFLNISLYNNIGTDLRMNVVRKNTKYYLDVVVNSNKEVKWYVILNLKKIYISPAEDNQTPDNLKYSTSDNLINWQPVISSPESTEICFKFIENLKFVNISPFSKKIIDENTEYQNSVIDDSLEFSFKNTAYKIEDDDNSVCEIVGQNLYIDDLSSSFGYNIYGYQANILIQPSLDNNKKLATSYAHSSYNSYDDTNQNYFFNNEFGNSFSSDLNQNMVNFSTSNLETTDISDFYWNRDKTTKINNKKIRFVFQLKEKEIKYQPLIGVVYYRFFCAKSYNDKSDSIIHRESFFEQINVQDISENISITLQLYKRIDNFIANIPKQIYLTQRDSGIEELRYFDLGTHHFIKSYINIIDITNKKNVFCTHYASIIIPTFTTMRQYFTQLVSDGITDIDEIKAKFQQKYINSDNTIINELDLNSYSEDTSDVVLHESAPDYINSNGQKYISENGKDLESLKFELKINTEPIFPDNTADIPTLGSNIPVNSTQFGDEIAYKTFDIKFPIKVMCTSRNNSKYQTYILAEINKFKITTY